MRLPQITPLSSVYSGMLWREVFLTYQEGQLLDYCFIHPCIAQVFGEGFALGKKPSLLPCRSQEQLRVAWYL